MVGWLKRLFFQQQEEPVAVTGIKVGDGNVELTVRSNLRKLYNVKVTKGVHDGYVLGTDCYDIVGVSEFVWSLPVDKLIDVCLEIDTLEKRIQISKTRMGIHISRRQKPNPDYLRKYIEKQEMLAKEQIRLRLKRVELIEDIINPKEQTEWDTTERRKR